MRARWNDLPLRLRLSVLYVGLLLVLLVAFGSFLYLDTRTFMISTTALRLEALADTAMGHVVSPGPPGGRIPPPGTTEPVTPTVPLVEPSFDRAAVILARDLTWQDYVTVVVDKTGAVIADGRNSSDERTIPALEPASLTRALAGDPVTYVTTVSGRDTLVVLVPVRFPRPDSAVAGVIEMSASLDLVNQVLAREGLLIGIGVLLALVLGTVGGMWLTQAALTPLRLVIATCRRIAKGDLSQRVNLPQRKDETGQLASAFDEMVARLDDLFTAQRQFVADASHELRTPLTAISGSIEVLLLAPEGDPETARRVLHGMRREVQRLTRLVADLLTLTRLDARRPLNLQVVDLAALEREVVEQMRPLAKNRKVVIETDGDSRCAGDADQLKQVFYNLLDNAVHSTDAENGTIVLRVQGLERAVRVAVSDNGTGIPEPARPHVFERFYRADKARARAHGGSGLGLAIVKAIVEGHGGSIDPVESELGHGTTIRFTLPRAGDGVA